MHLGPILDSKPDTQGDPFEVLHIEFDILVFERRPNDSLTLRKGEPVIDDQSLIELIDEGHFAPVCSDERIHDEDRRPFFEFECSAEEMLGRDARMIIGAHNLT